MKVEIMTAEDKAHVLRDWCCKGYITDIEHLEKNCKLYGLDCYDDVLSYIGWNFCDRCGALGNIETDFVWIDGFDWEDENENDQAILRAIKSEDDYCAVCWDCIEALKKKGKANAKDHVRV